MFDIDFYSKEVCCGISGKNVMLHWKKSGEWNNKAIHGYIYKTMYCYQDLGVIIEPEIELQYYNVMKGYNISITFKVTLHGDKDYPEYEISNRYYRSSYKASKDEAYKHYAETLLTFDKNYSLVHIITHCKRACAHILKIHE